MKIKAIFLLALGLAAIGCAPMIDAALDQSSNFSSKDKAELREYITARRTGYGPCVCDRITSASKPLLNPNQVKIVCDFRFVYWATLHYNGWHVEQMEDRQTFRTYSVF